MNKIRVKKILSMSVNNVYIVDFVTLYDKIFAICVSDDNKIEKWNIEDLEIDFNNFNS